MAGRTGKLITTFSTLDWVELVETSDKVPQRPVDFPFSTLDWVELVETPFAEP